MVSEAFLVRALVALGVIFALSLAFILGHGAWLAMARRYARPRLARGRAALAAVVASEEAVPEAVAVLRSLPHHIRIRLFVEISRSVGGGARDRLRQIAEAVGTLAAAERMTRSRHWWRRLRGVRLLMAVGGSESAILAHLHDPHPDVRAQAAEWAADHPSDAILRTLLEMLSESDVLYRFTVQDSLLRVGQGAVEPLAEYLERHRGIEALPALEVAVTLTHPMLTRPALAHCRAPHPELRARAAEVLGGTGGAEAIEMLSGLLADPAPGVRAASARALARLRHWPAAARLAPLLRDPAWEVRQAAGLGLLALGSPGLLFLRRYRSDPDRFAADMATQVLDLPGAVEEAYL